MHRIYLLVLLEIGGFKIKRKVGDDGKEGRGLKIKGRGRKGPRKWPFIVEKAEVARPWVEGVIY